MSSGRKLVLLLVLAVSAWHLVAIAAWMAPPGWLRDRVVRLTRRYVRLTKSDQSWGMFAPDPLSVNRRLVVRARLAGGAERELDMTAPVNAAMRAPFSLRRVGKTLKAHDRILAGDEPVYQHGYALHACHELAGQLGEKVELVTLIREYTVLVQDTRTFKFSRTAPERAELGTYACAD